MRDTLSRNALPAHDGRQQAYATVPGIDQFLPVNVYGPGCSAAAARGGCRPAAASAGAGAASGRTGEGGRGYGGIKIVERNEAVRCGNQRQGGLGRRRAGRWRRIGRQEASGQDLGGVAGELPSAPGGATPRVTGLRIDQPGLGVARTGDDHGQLISAPKPPPGPGQWQQERSSSGALDFQSVSLHFLNYEAYFASVGEAGRVYRTASHGQFDPWACVKWRSAERNGCAMMDAFPEGNAGSFA